jgi:hypothetical protein
MPQPWDSSLRYEPLKTTKNVAVVVGEVVVDLCVQIPLLS